MAASQPLIASALELIDEAFQKKAWHGPNLRGTIRGLGAHDLYHAGQIQLLKRLRPLLPAAVGGEQYPQAIDRQRLHGEPVARHRLRPQHRVVHRLLGGLEDGLEQR